MVIVAERNGYTRQKKTCPFRLFTNATLPKAIYRRFKIEWQPIMKKMESTTGMRLPVSASVNQYLLHSTFELATSHLRENVCSFLFQDKKKRIESWTVGSWSCCTHRSYILKKLE